MDVDTTTPGGKLVANVMASVAEWERETIGARTRDALPTKRVQGVRLGRPRTLPLEVLQRIVAERAGGRTMRAIAEGLTTDGVPTAQGGVWRPGSWLDLFPFSRSALIRQLHSGQPPFSQLRP